MVEGEVVVGRPGRCLATSRLELTAEALVRRSVETEGLRMSRFKDDDGFLMLRFELVDGRRSREEVRDRGDADFEDF